MIPLYSENNQKNLFSGLLSGKNVNDVIPMELVHSIGNRGKVFRAFQYGGSL